MAHLRRLAPACVLAASLLAPGAVHAAPAPDLAVVRVASAQTSLSPSVRLVVQDRTTNRGATRSRHSVTGFYLTRGTHHTGADIQIGSRRVPALRPHHSSTASSPLAVPTFTPGGKWRITACADDTRRVREKIESNNCRTLKSTLTIVPTPIPAPSVKLAVTKDGSGSGTVTSDRGGIDCGASCTASFANGVFPVLTATPAAGSRFAGWSGGCSGTLPTCNPSRDAKATFVQRVTAAVGQANGGQATVTGSDPTASCAPDACSVDIGTNVIYTAAPGAGFRFNAWSGSCAGGGPTVNLTGLTQDVSCTPSFKAAVAVRWNVTGSQGGSVTGAVVSGTGSCGASSCLVDKGSSVSLTRSAAHAGWRFQNWTGDCAVAGSGTGLTFPSLSADRNCGAVFIQQFTVAYSKNDTQNDPANTVSAGLSGGVGSCQNNVCTVDKGSTVTITATAGGANSVFNGWTGSCAGMANPAQLANVSGNKTCVAQFVHS